MHILNVLRKSSELFYVRADAAGRVIESNNLFRIQIDILNAQDSKLSGFTTPRGEKIIKAAASRARIADWPVSFQIPLKQHDHTHMDTWWEIGFIDGEFFLIGDEIFRRDTSDTMKLRKQSRVLREVAWIQSHYIRGPLANILGAVSLLKETPEDKKIMEMLDKAAQELDSRVRQITHLSGSAN